MVSVTFSLGHIIDGMKILEDLVIPNTPRTKCISFGKVGKKSYKKFPSTLCLNMWLYSLKI